MDFDVEAESALRRSLLSMRFGSVTIKSVPDQATPVRRGEGAASFTPRSCAAGHDDSPSCEGVGGDEEATTLEALRIRLHSPAIAGHVSRTGPGRPFSEPHPDARY
jgi:hypothetical protein